jgi:hypothetical protein
MNHKRVKYTNKDKERQLSLILELINTNHNAKI